MSVFFIFTAAITINLAIRKKEIIFSTNWKDGSVLSKPIKRRREIKKVIKEVHKATDLEFRFEDSSLPWGISKMNKTPTNGRKVIIDNKFQFSIL